MKTYAYAVNLTDIYRNLKYTFYREVWQLISLINIIIRNKIK